MSAYMLGVVLINGDGGGIKSGFSNVTGGVVVVVGDDVNEDEDDEMVDEAHEVFTDAVGKLPSGWECGVGFMDVDANERSFDDCEDSPRVFSYCCNSPIKSRFGEIAGRLLLT